MKMATWTPNEYAWDDAARRDHATELSASEMSLLARRVHDTAVRGGSYRLAQAAREAIDNCHAMMRRLTGAADDAGDENEVVDAAIRLLIEAGCSRATLEAMLDGKLSMSSRQ